MAILTIVTYPAEVLRKRTKSITEFNEQALSSLVKNMTETMYDAPGVGLAANQIGLSLRLAVIDAVWKQDNDKKELHVFINPEIIEKEELIDFEEGCLSLPGMSGITKRYNKVTVRYQNLKGKEQTLSTKGLLAIALQHETDHLNGKLYVDHLSPIKRTILLKRFKKLSAAKE